MFRSDGGPMAWLRIATPPEEVTSASSDGESRFRAESVEEA